MIAQDDLQDAAEEAAREPLRIVLTAGHQRQLAEIRAEAQAEQQRHAADCARLGALEQAVLKAVLYGAGLKDLSAVSCEVTEDALLVTPKDAA